MNVHRLRAIFLLTVGLMTSSVYAQEPPGESFIIDQPLYTPAEQKSKCVELKVDLTYSSKYVWRGLDLVDGSVFQPVVALTYKGFTASVFGNLDISNVNGHSGKFSEFDFILDYTGEFGSCCLPIEYSLGVIHYVFPATSDPATTELYAGFGLDWELSPSFVAYYDVNEVNGWYLNAALSKSWERLFCPLPCVTIGAEAAASLGWGSSKYNQSYFSLNKSRFLDLLLIFSLPTEINCWSVSPFISYSYLIDSDIRKSNSTNDSNLWGGVTISRSF